MKKLTRTEFRDGAKEIILRHLREDLFKNPDAASLDDVRVVWILRYGNRDWKGEFDTTVPDGKIYEVDYGTNHERYHVYVHAKLYKLTVLKGSPNEAEAQGTEDCPAGS